MPIRTRQPEAMDTMTLHHVAVPRLGGADGGDPSASAEVLLSSGALLRLAPVPAPARALALDASRVVRA